MQDSKLQSDLIARTADWHLGLLIAPGSLDIALIPTSEAGPGAKVVYRHRQYDTEAPSQLKAVEDIVYDNPLLLNDYKSVTCLISHTDYTFLPPALSAAERLSLFTMEHPEAGEPIFEELRPCCNALMLSAPPADLEGFVRRTFFQSRLVHPLSLAVRYMAGEVVRGHSVTAALYDNRIEVTAMRGPRLTMSNSFAIRTPRDAAYYILAVMHTFGFDRNTTPVKIYGHEGTPLQQVADELNRYLPGITVRNIALPYSLELLRRQLA